MNTKFWTAFSSIEQLDSTFIQRLYNYFGNIETAFNANDRVYIGILPNEPFDELCKDANYEVDSDPIISLNVAEITLKKLSGKK